MKKVIALIMVLMMVVTLLPVSAFADTTPTFSVESNWAMPGSTINVNVSIANNPGLIGANLVFELPDGLSIVGASAGDAFSALDLTIPQILKNGGELTGKGRFIWSKTSIEEKDIKDGVILTLQLKISENAKLDEELKISISTDEIDGCIGNDGEPVSVNLSEGIVTVIDYTPGDVDQNGMVTLADVIKLLRYVADDCKTDPLGYNVTIKEEAADINADGRISLADIIRLLRFIADDCKTDPNGYNIKLLPAYKPCEHANMEHYDAKAASCTEDGNIEYWHCAKCDKYFTDAAGNGRIALSDTVLAALGHNVVIDPAVEPTYTSTGLTEGSHCARCNEVLIKQSVIPILVREEYAITYNIANGDAYLAAQSIENPNDAYYTSSDGYTLKNISVPGYRFLGWYDLPSGSNAVNIKKIAAGEKGEVELYAHWEKIEYTVQFKSNLIPVDSVTYTVDKGIVLPTPKLSGYSFTGWSNGDGIIVDALPVGTLGDTVLSANWLSERNKAWAKKEIGKPIIVEDKETNSILFTYEIGRVENVPLYVIEDFGYINEDGVSKEISKEYTIKITDTMMNQSAKSIADSTTNSAQWSLSSGWSDQVSVNENYLKENNIDETTAKTIGTTDTSNWLVSTGKSGSTTTTKYESSQDYDLNTTTGNTKTYDVNDDSSSHKRNLELDVRAETKATAGVEGIASSEVSVSGELKEGQTWTDTSASKTGTEVDAGNNTQTGSIKHTGTDSAKTSGWNTSESYGGSKSVNSSNSFSTTISEKISSEYGYGKSFIKNGEESNLQGTETSTSSSNSYTAAITYSLDETMKESITYSTSNTKTGYHRLVKAGTAHVFAVVGYNIETAAYFISTYTVMDDEMHNFEDYSYKTAAYDDNQNGVIPFEVPYEVEEYILSKVGETDGLEFSEAGVVTAYTGTEKTVFIPQYRVIDGKDGTKKVVKVTAISPTAFAGNTDITGIVLPEDISEIPAKAFDGCSSLTMVKMPGVTSIGEEAFKDCHQIDYIFLSNKIKSIGKDAFDNMKTFGVYTDSLEIIDGAINSGAKNVYIFLAGSISYTPEGDKNSGRKELVIGSSTDKFVLNGCGNSLENILVKSDASRTVVNNITLNSTAGTPLNISSESVRLGRINVNSSGFALMLTNDNCALELYGESTITSTSGNGMLCRNVTVSKAQDAITGGTYSELKVNGNILKCGQITNVSLIKCNGSIIDISEEDYAKYVKGMFTVTFNANEGTVSESTRVCYYGSATDKLPVPERTGFTFNGWYTTKDSGTLITESTISSLNKDCTLYAHWTPKEYTANWDNGTGYTISVNRTASPNKDAAIGELNSGDAVYYGDTLEISYTAADYYHITANGKTSITVDEAFNPADIFATAELNPLSDWTLASEVPDEAKVENTKWNYTLREYTTNSAATLTGWTKYDTKRTSWGAWSGWSTTNPTNGVRNVESRSVYDHTEYHYYRWYNGTSVYTYQYNSGYWLEEKWFTYILPTTSQFSSIGYVGSDTAKNWWVRADYESNRSVSKTFSKSVNRTEWRYQDPVYTYYYYRDVEKEATADPTGQDNVSNVVMYVQYRAK